MNYSFKNIFASAMLGALLLSNAPVVAHGEAAKTLKLTEAASNSKLTKAGLLLLMAVAARHYLRIPNSEPNRYDLDKFTVETLRNNPVEFIKNVWFYIDDAVIGHGEKKAGVQLDKDTMQIFVIKEGAKLRGIGGWINENKRGILSVLALPAAMKFYEDGVLPYGIKVEILPYRNA